MRQSFTRSLLFRPSILLSRQLSTNYKAAVSNHYNRLRVGEDQYACDFSTPFAPNVSAVLESIAQETPRISPKPYMKVEETQAKFLRQMVRIVDAANVLDIGTFTGTSAIAMALALREDGKVVSLDADAKAQAVAQHSVEQLQLQDRVDFRLGDALESLATLAVEKPQVQFDFVYIDADKEGYISYFDFIMDHNLLSDKGLIIADNVLFSGLVHRNAGYEDECLTDVNKSFDEVSKHIAKFNQHVLRDPRVEVTIVPLFDGVSFIRKKC